MVVGRQKPAANERLEIGGCRGNGRIQSGFAGTDGLVKFARPGTSSVRNGLGVELRVRAMRLWYAQGGCAFESCRSWSSGGSGPDIAAAEAPRKGATEERRQGSGALLRTEVVEERPGQGLFLYFVGKVPRVVRDTQLRRCCVVGAWVWVWVKGEG